MRRNISWSQELRPSSITCWRTATWTRENLHSGLYWRKTLITLSGETWSSTSNGRYWLDDRDYEQLFDCVDGWRRSSGQIFDDPFSHIDLYRWLAGFANVTLVLKTVLWLNPEESSFYYDLKCIKYKYTLSYITLTPEMHNYYTCFYKFTCNGFQNRQSLGKIIIWLYLDIFFSQEFQVIVTLIFCILTYFVCLTSWRPRVAAKTNLQAICSLISSIMKSTHEKKHIKKSER